MFSLLGHIQELTNVTCKHTDLHLHSATRWSAQDLIKSQKNFVIIKSQCTQSENRLNSLITSFFELIHLTGEPVHCLIPNQQAGGENYHLLEGRKMTEDNSYPFPYYESNFLSINTEARIIALFLQFLWIYSGWAEDTQNIIGNIWYYTLFCLIVWV